MKFALLAALLAAAVQTISAQPYGLEERVPNTALVLDDPTSPPLKISDMPALYTLATGGQVPGVIPYEPQVPLWSDGALKTRHMALPGLSQITYRGTDSWDFPDKAILVKNFSMPLVEGDANSAIRIETRLLVKNGSQWNGYSYRWNDEGTDAQLLAGMQTRSFTVQTDSGSRTFDYIYPARFQCLQCHTQAANFTLSPQTIQLNHDFTYPQTGVTDNQLRTLEHIGMFSAPLPAPPDELDRLPSIHDESKSLLSRTKAYVHANCSFCHRPSGGTPAAIDLRWDRTLAQMNVLGVAPARGELGLDDPDIVMPGVPERSVLYYRISEQTQYRMPPMFSKVVDEDARQLIQDWISAMAYDQQWTVR